MGSKKTKTTSNETATTTPNLPTKAIPAVDNYFGKVDTLLNNPPNLLVPTNALQDKAFAGASELGGGNGFGTAAGLLSQGANAINAVGPAKTVSAALPTAYNPYLGEVGKLPTAATVDTGFLGGVNPISASGQRASQFVNDYQPMANQALVNSTLANYDHQALAERAAYDREGALNNAFGGSGYAIGRGELIGNQGRNRALTEAELRDLAYTRALGAASGDADRGTNASIASMQSANSLTGQLAGYQSQAAIADAEAKNRLALAGFDAGNDMTKFNASTLNDVLGQIYGTTANMNQFNTGQANDMNQFNANLSLDKGRGLLDAAGTAGNLATSSGADTRANIGLQADLGNDAYNRSKADQLVQYQQLQMINDLLTGGGLLGTATGQTIKSDGTSTTKESGGLLGSLLGPLASLGSAAIAKSERRVKRDIVKRTEDRDGLPWYTFRYVWDADTAPIRFGVMVDEVERIRPWALGPVVDGVRTVNYSRLEAF